MTRRETSDKNRQKLERMRKIACDAVRLKNAIKSEVDAILDEIDAEINSPRKAKSVFWDGKQPHYWRENGRMFRKAMKYDIGKTVVVCSWDDPSPLRNLENKALLEGITQFDDFTVRSTNGARLCHFPIAWVDCHPFDTSFDDVPHICVFMGNTLAKVADKPEQLDPLIDEESCVEPEPQSDHIADANKKVPPAGYRLLDNSAKVEPRESGDLFWSRTGGDWVELLDDCVEYANRDDWPACRKIDDPVEKPETIARYDSEGRDVTQLTGLWTEGDTQYREPTQADLSNGPIEVDVCDDGTQETNWEKRMLYAVLPTKFMFPYVVGSPGLDEFTETWRFARIKVDDPAKEPEAQYRTPHPGDVGKQIEVSDAEGPTSDMSGWVKRTLVAVLSFPDERPQGEFVTAVEGYDVKHIYHTWKHARIKVEG